MKRILLLCLMALSSVVIWAAEEPVWCLAVVENNGEEIYFALDADPVITHGVNSITVVSSDYSIIDLSLDLVKKLYHTEAIPMVDGINNISNMEGASPEFTNGKVFITGLQDGTQVYIYTADGRIVGSVTASVDGNVCVDLNSLKGNQVYILRTPSVSYKIVK